MTDYLYLEDNDLTGSLDAFCDIDFDYFAANICGQEDEINCTCCTHCCYLEPFNCCHLEPFECPPL